MTRWLLAVGVLIPLYGAQATQDQPSLHGQADAVRDPGFQGNAAAWFVHGLLDRGLPGRH